MRDSGIKLLGRNTIARLWAMRDDPFCRLMLRASIKDAQAMKRHRKWALGPF